ncbi:MAG: hypothetical protein IPN93_03165 [Bacteroidetes bacterium]|nr:hypothetical protein [Bacteroidota bacterium]
MPVLTRLWRDTLQYDKIGLVGVCVDRNKDKMNDFIVKMEFQILNIKFMTQLVRQFGGHTTT